MYSSVPLQHSYYFVAVLRALRLLLASVCPAHLMSDPLLPLHIPSSSRHRLPLQVISRSRCICQYTQYSHAAVSPCFRHNILSFHIVFYIHLCVHGFIPKITKARCGTCVFFYRKLSTHVTVRLADTGPSRLLQDERKKEETPHLLEPVIQSLLLMISRIGPTSYDVGHGLFPRGPREGEP